MILILSLVLLVSAAAIYLASSIHRVPTGYVGVVHRRYGPSHPDDRFKVRTGGSVGPQAAVLEADRVYFRPRLFYRVVYVRQTYVAPGTIGVVVANAGNPPPPHRMLSRHVDCDYFQDGRAFLLGGGQMGRQPAILPGGAFYDINPLLFEVLTVHTIGGGRHGLSAVDLMEISVPEGTTGVVIALEGETPDEDDGAAERRVPGHESFQLPSVFLENRGQRGVQEETLSHGSVYRINPWFARVILIPTRDLILEWTRREKKPSTNFDAPLDQIVVSVEGHRLQFDMTQTIRIPAQAAPRLVGRFGEQVTDPFGTSATSNTVPVQRFVEKVLGSTVEGYFHATASQYQVLEFISRRDEVRLELEDRVRQALAEWEVQAVRTTLGEFMPLDQEVGELQRAIAAERERQQELKHRAENAALEAEIDQTRISTDRDRRKLGVVELEERIRLLGREPVALERYLAKFSKMKVPEFVGADAGQLLQYLPLPVALDMINRVLSRAEPGATVPSSPELAIAPSTGQDELPATTTDDPQDPTPIATPRDKRMGNPPAPERSEPATTPAPAGAPPQYSPDGRWYWDGRQWRYWDGQQWRPAATPGPAYPIRPSAS